MPPQAKRRSDEERLAEGGLREPERRVDGVRDPERPERRLDRAAPALERGHHDADLRGAGPAAQEVEHLLADELERAARAGALEEADRTLDRRRRLGATAEEGALEVGQRGVRDLFVAGRELLDRAGRQALEALRGVPQPLEGRPAGLVRKRDGDVGAARERLEQRPLGRGQVLEAVGEERLPLPGAEVVGEPLGGRGAEQLRVPEAEAVELRAVGGDRASPEAPRGRSDVEQPRLDLPDRVAERVREPGRARRLAEPVELAYGRRHARSDERLLRLGEHRAAAADVPRRSARRDRGTCRSSRRGAPGCGPAARARPSRRPAGSAR